MYCGYIVELSGLRKHANADRLQCTEVFGNNVIVSLDYFEGQKCVYFPSDGKLGEKFAMENNLLRIKDENGKNTGGYLDPEKRNIRAIKLRGEKSDGLVLPVESLKKFTDITKLNVGDKITTLGGEVICEKYIPVRKNKTSGSSGNSKSNSKKSKKESKIQYPYFEEHVDTAQLAYSKAAFKEGDLCTITLKCHGCFTAETRVMLWGQKRAKQISKIEKGDVVIGYKNGKLVPSKVLETFQNGKTKEWRQVEVSREGMIGERRSKIRCTPNHLFWDKNQQRYIEAKDLKVGQKLGFVKESLIFSHELKEMLLGLYLGDGYLCIRQKVAKIETGQKKEHKDYLEYIIRITNGLFHMDQKDYISGYGTPMSRILSKECVEMKQFFNSILSKDGTNKLSEDILPYFTDITVAFLYMDDGSLCHNETQRDRAAFAICDYNDHDAEIISRGLSNLGYANTLHKDPKGYNRIRILTDASEKMYENIQKYIPPVMRYKLPQKYQKITPKTEPIFSCETGYLFIENEVLSNEPFEVSHGKVKYDLHTETDNYVVGGVVVHNSSQRVANTEKITVKSLTWWQKLLRRQAKVQKEWGYVSGTRRTVINSFEEPGGYYGSNAFRKPYHDFFKDKLEKGEEIYFEICGWVDSNKTIMAIGDTKKLKDSELIKLYGDQMIFDYGCERGQNRIFVYRMTMTNEDGYVVEYPDWLMRMRCEQMGVECVPLFETFRYTTWEDLMERVEKYYDGPDPIGKTHVREGVVVRIQNRVKFTAYKHKNITFKIIEGLIKDTADAPDMEEAEELIRQQEAGENNEPDSSS